MFEETLKENSRFSEENLHLVTFELSGEEFGVDIMQVSEVIPVPRITRIPQAPECIKGLINLRGKILVVIDLNKRLGFSSKETDSLSRIIIVEDQRHSHRNACKLRKRGHEIAFFFH